MSYLLTISSKELAALSRWVDSYLPNLQRSAEAKLWGRVAKIGEEYGEVIAAMIGYTDQNPRKGITHDSDDIRKELLDVAVTALCAYEHLTGNTGRSLPELLSHTSRLVERAGI